jgi:hypothetical protein
MTVPEDKSSELQAYLNALDDPNADFRALGLARIRAMLDRAVFPKNTIESTLRQLAAVS